MHKFGGMEQLARGLKTGINENDGLYVDQDVSSERQKYFGKNEYPDKEEMRSYWYDDDTVKVMRKKGKDDPKSEEIEIEKNELLVGDIINLKKTMKIPADCILIWHRLYKDDVTASESRYRGEYYDHILKTVITEENYKHNNEGVLWAGT